MSDLHLEFGALDEDLTKFTGQYLLLAGDITLLNALNPTKTDKDNRKLRKRTHAFFDIVTQNFEKVFYITGNHESYSSDILKEKEIVNTYLPKVHFLENESIELENDIVLYGSTLWTSLNDNNPNDVMRVSTILNDFRQISYGKRLFTPTDFIHFHNKGLYELKKTLKNYENKKIVVMTHHSPCHLGLSDIRSDPYYDSAYYTDLSNIMLNYENLLHWVHGHTHVQKEYEVGHTKVYSNARGYKNIEVNKTFSLNKSFFV